MARNWLIIPAATCCLLCACGDSGGGPEADATVGPDGALGLQITIVSPKQGASGVSVTKPQIEARFSQALAKPDLLEVVLLKDGKQLHGLKKYSATELRVIFTPFSILQSQSTYTIKVRAEGVEATASFTTEKANEGPLPPVEGQTFDFRIKAITYPGDLAPVFNSQLQTAPPVLMHLVSVQPGGSQGGNSVGAFVIAGSPGKPGDPKGQAAVLPEDSTHTHTTAMAIKGQMEGTWFGAGPADLHLTASGLPMVIRDFLATGIFSADGKNMTSVQLTGLLDPVELGKGLGVDLSFICKDARFKKYCDAQNRLRVAAEVESTLNPISFTTFITSPVNAVTDAAPTAEIQAYFSEEVDQTTTLVKVTDPAGVAVSGQATFSKKGLTFKPASPLSSKTKHEVEVVGQAKGGGGSDTRHLFFTTKDGS